MGIPRPLFVQFRVLLALAFGVSIALPALGLTNVGITKLGNEAGFSKVLTTCVVAEGAADLDEAISLVISYAGYKEDPKTLIWKPPLDVRHDIKIGVLKSPMHGVAGKGAWFAEPDLYAYWSTERDSDGISTYSGPDRVVMLVEIKGMKYKLIVNILVGTLDDRFAYSSKQCQRYLFKK